MLEDGGIQVVDDGRGIPVAMHASGAPTVEVVMTQLHAGGKFDSDAYAVSGGLHGVGISVVNALSTKVEVDINVDGYRWSQTYEHAKPGRSCRASPRPIPAPPSGSGGSGDLRDHHLQLRDGRAPPAGDGVPQQGPHHHPHGRASRRGRGHRRRRPRHGRGAQDGHETEEEAAAPKAPKVKSRVYHYPAASRTTCGSSTAPSRRSTTRSSVSPPRAPATSSRSRCSGTPAIRSRCTPSPTPSTPTRAAPTRRASARRSPRS